MKTNTKIYTEEFVLNELTLLLKTLKEDKDIVYLWELFINKDYSRQRFSEWLTEYNTNEEIKEISDTIKEILETRAVKWAITNKLNPTMTIFHLKNNYKDNWKDKSEVDQTLKWSLETNINEEQMRLIANRVLNGKTSITNDTESE